MLTQIMDTLILQRGPNDNLAKQVLSLEIHDSSLNYPWGSNDDSNHGHVDQKLLSRERKAFLGILPLVVID